eukprot:20636-Heterococcus_DN1.PRE.5
MKTEPAYYYYISVPLTRVHQSGAFAGALQQTSAATAFHLAVMSEGAYNGSSATKRCSVVVIGSGAVGCLYGARLLQAGHDVTFVMRSDYEACKANGLAISSPDGDYHVPAAELKVVRSTANMGAVDWVVFGLKAYSIRTQAVQLAGPCLGPQTKVLAITNGLIDDDLRALFGNDRVYGAIAFVCSVRPSPGIVQHLKYGHLLVGHIADDTAALNAVTELWAGSKVQVILTDCLLHSRWEKLLYNAPFSGLSLALNGTAVDKISTDPDLRALASHVMQETLNIGNADLKARGLTARLAPELLTKMWYLTDNAGPYVPSASVDLLAGRPLELEHLLEVPLARAHALGVAAGHLETVLLLAKAVDRARNLQ